MTGLKRFLPVILLMLSGIFHVAGAQEQQPVAYGIFFYSPSCPHCQDVIDNHWDGIQSEFGDALKVVFVNVQIPEGSQLMQSTTAAMGIESNSVPMLILGETVLIGSYDIPGLAPGIIHDGIDSGGINVPPVPEIEEIFALALGDDYVVNEHSELIVEPVLSDPANIMALGMLFALIVSLIIIVLAGFNPKMQNRVTGSVGFSVLIFSTLAGIGLTGSLIAGSDNWRVSVLVLAIIIILFVILFMLIKQQSVKAVRDTVIPLLSIVGMLVAGYLSYVEITASEASCGLTGACNLVQQSQYAYLFGVPIGIIGVAGYALLLGLWLFGQMNQHVFVPMLFLVGSGVLFSIYLTFLEPFVIGATCIWCLTSALIMMVLLWAVASVALEEMHRKSSAIAS